MKRLRRHAIGASALLLTLLLSASSAYAQSAAIGRGLNELVNLYESGSPKLPVVLKQHLSAGTDEVMVNVRLTPGATAAAASTLALEGFRLTATSALDPNLLEGFMPLYAVRTAAWTGNVKSILAVHRPYASAGSVQSQAVALQKADIAQARGIDGTGIRVGALSDSYNQCPTCSTQPAQDVTTGDLPGDVVVLQDLLPANGPGADGGIDELELLGA